MTQLKDSQLLVGIVPNFGNFTFKANAKTTLKGTNGGNAAVPLPGGRLVPSGRTEISHALMSASDMGFPSFGDWIPEL